MSSELKKGDLVRLKQDVAINKDIEGLAISIVLGAGDVAFVLNTSGDAVSLDFHGVVEGGIARSLGIQGSVEVDAAAVELLQPVVLDAAPEQPAPEVPEMNCKTNRYSTATIKAPCKRPEVFLYQGALKAVGQYDGAVDGWYGDGSKEATRAFQDANGLEDDGIIGTGTATELIKQAKAAGFQPDLNLRIMSIITMYEVSNRMNAYGMAENDIGDRAGANYGIFQCNSLGSVKSMLRLAGRNDLVSVYKATNKKTVNPNIQDWFGSAEGIATQNKYFETKILRLGMKELRAFGKFDAWESDPAMQVYWGRAVLLFCDSIVQNGTTWSGSRRPFWKDLIGAKGKPKSQNIPELYYGTWWDEQLGQYIEYGVDGTAGMKKLWWDHYGQHGGDRDGTHNKKACRAANQSAAAAIIDMIPGDDPSSRLSVVAHVRSRSSWHRYWYQAVASRRITDAYGTSAKHPSGVVNGQALDLACDYQL